MRWLLISLALGFSFDADARRKKRDKKKKSEKTEQTTSQKEEVFAAAYEAIANGQNEAAVNALYEITKDSANTRFHAEAFHQLAMILEDLKLNYSALIAYNKALKVSGIDPILREKSIDKILKLADVIGDSPLLTQVLTGKIEENLDEVTLSRLRYLKARDAIRMENYGEALTLLDKIKDEHPDAIEAKNLESVVLAQQGRYESALVTLQIALSIFDPKKDSEKLRDVLTLNLARSFYAAGNFPQAAEYFSQIPRKSPYWLEAQFELSWAFFRMTDVNRMLGILHTHGSPFFADDHYPESDLLRIYGFFLMCKFKEADKQIDIFNEKYLPHAQTLQRWSSEDPKVIFATLEKTLRSKTQDTGPLPYLITRHYQNEDRIKESLRAVENATKEEKTLQSMGGFSGEFIDLIAIRKAEIIDQEGTRIRKKIEGMSNEIDGMLRDIKITKLDIIELEKTMLERAAAKGKIEEARRLAKRKKRKKKDTNEWPFQGEYWADELGYFRIETKSECPASMTQGSE